MHIYPLAQRLGGTPHGPMTSSPAPTGAIYFTDPGGRLTAQERELDFSGVHRIDPDGTLTNVTAETEYPNGLAFSPDERILYVAITRGMNTVRRRSSGRGLHAPVDSRL